MPNPVLARRVRGSTFNPRLLPGLKLWLKADGILGLTDGTALSTWTDSSNAGNNAVQATGTKQPLFKTNIVGGLPAVLFDGSNDCLTVASFVLTTHTIFLVFKDAVGNCLYYEHGPDANANPGIWLYSESPPSVMHTRTVATAQSIRNLAAGWGHDGNLKLVRVQGDGTHAGHRIWINQSEYAATGGSSTTDPGSGSLTDTLNIGGRNNGASLVLNGYIMEFLICSPALPEMWAAKTERYLHAKWGTP